MREKKYALQSKLTGELYDHLCSKFWVKIRQQLKWPLWDQLKEQFGDQLEEELISEN